MPRALRYIAYVVLFAFSFLVFLYWTFPYDVLKDRLINAIERQVGEGLEITIRDFDSYWFTGVEVEGLAIKDPSGKVAVIDIDSAHARASFFSLLFGNPRVAFAVDLGEGEVGGVVRQSEDRLLIDVELDDFDIGELKVIERRTGLKFSSKIGGDVDLSVDRQRQVRSTGKISLNMNDIRLDASEATLGEMALPLPALILSERRGSGIEVGIEKGTVSIENFKLTGGDLEVDMKGKIFLSSRLENYRFNISGSFKASKKLGEALPFLYIVDKQKREDGSLPFSITGRMSRPTVKIGTFTLPI